MKWTEYLDFRFKLWIQGFLMIVDGIVTVLTLGWCPGWQVDYIFWWHKRRLGKKMKEGRRSADTPPKP